MSRPPSSSRGDRILSDLKIWAFFPFQRVVSGRAARPRPRLVERAALPGDERGRARLLLFSDKPRMRRVWDGALVFPWITLCAEPPRHGRIPYNQASWANTDECSAFRV